VAQGTGAAPPTVILGLGNLIQSDDGVGIHAVRLLENDERLGAGVAVIDGGTFGVQLAAYTAGAGHLIVLDSVDVGRDPGTLVRMDGSDLCGLPGGATAHGLGLADLLVALGLMGSQPPEVVLLGVQPATTALGTELSPAVRAALPALVEAALAEARRHRLARAIRRVERRGSFVSKRSRGNVS
jgi:hydrogenase maturation protease